MTSTMMTAEQSLTARRLVGELRQIERCREAYYQVVQDPKDPFLFYFLLRGDPKSPYAGGYYIGKIVLPANYPSQPGDFYMLTPSGRFNVDTKICLTNSSYHKENWTPMWSITNMVIAFVSIFTSDDTTGISHIKESFSERKEKSENSMKYNILKHKDICMKFTQFVKIDGTLRSDSEIKDWIASNAPKKLIKKEKNVIDTKNSIKIIKDAPVTETNTINNKPSPKIVPSDNIAKPNIKFVKTMLPEDKNVPDNNINNDDDGIITIGKKSVQMIKKNNDKIDKIDKIDNHSISSERQIHVINKNKRYPTNYTEWRKCIDRLTLQTHDPKLFRMVF